MESEIKNNNTSSVSKTIKWYLNTKIIIGVIVVLVVVGYFTIPLLKTVKSPFTKYSPLDIDSTFLKLDTIPNSDKKNKEQKPDISESLDTVIPIPEVSVDHQSVEDSSLKVDLLKLNTSYEHLDPNEQLNIKSIDDPQDDLLSKLLLNELTESERDELLDLHLNYGIKSILRILSSTAVEILAGNRMNYHFEILNALEQSPSINGVLIINNDKRVVYSTNRKLKGQLISTSFPHLNFKGSKFELQKSGDLKMISMPVHHQYGKIGSIHLIY